MQGCVRTASCAVQSSHGDDGLVHLSRNDALEPCCQLGDCDGPLWARQVRQHIGIHAIAICPVRGRSSVGQKPWLESGLGMTHKVSGRWGAHQYGMNMMAIHSVTANMYWMQMDRYMFRTAGALMVACTVTRAWIT